MPKLRSSMPELLPSRKRDPAAGRYGASPAPCWLGTAQPGSPKGSGAESPSQPPRGLLPAALPCPLFPREPPAGPSLLAGEADPVLLTGDWRSRCPASPSSALGSCAAGLMLGIDRGSRSRAHIHAGSSTRTRTERTAFLRERGFPPASLFPSYTARGRTVPPPAGVTAGSRGAEVSPAPGITGQGCSGQGPLLRLPKGSPVLRQAEPRRRCCPRRGPGPARLFAPRAHTQPRMPFQIWRGWSDSVKGGVGFRR